MATEKFFVFNESGTLKRLKGRIVRFLDNEDPDNDDKVNIRASISVPASAEGLTPANNLSDLDNAATARTNLSVNSVDEDAEANGTKLLGPSVYFDGTNDYVEVADDAKLSFTDGTDDLPFTVAGWINMSDATNFTVASKYSSANEWRFYVNSLNDLSLALTDGTNSAFVVTDTDLSGYEGQWIHVSCTYSGAGPNSGNAFTAAANGISLYINGVAVSITVTNNASYAGMTDTSDPVRLGRHAAAYSKGHIRGVSLYNRELSASEVAELAKGNELGFADQYAGAFAGLGTIDETSGLASWSGAGSITADNLTETANTTVGGRANVLKQEATASSTGNTRFYITSTASLGKRIRVEFDYYIPSTNTTVDQIGMLFTGGPTEAQLTTTDAWTRASIEVIVFSSSNTLQFLLWDGGTDNATIGDYIGLDNFSITEIGTLADFRSERFDSSTGKWYDLSDNAFVGTNSGATLVGREVPVYETGTWTPTLTLGGGNTGMTYSVQDGNYTRIGNICHLNGIITLSAKGSSTGQVDLNGFPFAAANTASSQQTFVIGYASSVTGLTSAISGLIDDAGTEAQLYDWGATGATNIDDTNLTDTSNLRFSLTYQIQ